MSFVCGICHQPQPAHSKPKRVVTKTRARNYPARVYFIGGNKVEDPGGQGTEIVREVETCGACAPTQEQGK